MLPRLSVPGIRNRINAIRTGHAREGKALKIPSVWANKIPTVDPMFKGEGLLDFRLRDLLRVFSRPPPPQWEFSSQNLDFSKPERILWHFFRSLRLRKPLPHPKTIHSPLWGRRGVLIALVLYMSRTCCQQNENRWQSTLSITFSASGDRAPHNNMSQSTNMPSK